MILLEELLSIFVSCMAYTLLVIVGVILEETLYNKYKNKGVYFAIFISETTSLVISSLNSVPLSADVMGTIFITFVLVITAYMLIKQE